MPLKKQRRFSGYPEGVFAFFYSGKGEDSVKELQNYRKEGAKPNAQSLYTKGFSFSILHGLVHGL